MGFTLENCPFLLKLNIFNHCDPIHIHLGFKYAPEDRQRIFMEALSNGLAKTIKNLNVIIRRDTYSGYIYIGVLCKNEKMLHTKS